MKKKNSTLNFGERQVLFNREIHSISEFIVTLELRSCQCMENINVNPVAARWTQAKVRTMCVMTA